MRSFPRALLLLGTVLVGCDGLDVRHGPTLWTDGQAAGRRQVTEVEWTRAWKLGGEEDDLLASLGPMAVVPGEPGGLILGDVYDARVLGISLEGEVVWTFGRRGEGPGEFQRIQDIQADARGVIHVLDNENRRITRLDDAGTFLGDIEVPEGIWFSMVPLPDGYLLEGSDGLEPFSRLTTSPPAATPGAPNASSGDAGLPAATRTAEIAGSFGMPWEGFADLHQLQRQGRVLTAPDGRWVYTFLFGNGWFPHQGTLPLGYLGKNVEHSEFPAILTETSRLRRTSRLLERPRCANCSGWISGDTVHFHFGGSSEDALRVVDRYDWTSGEYLGSIRLPGQATRVVQAGGLHILLIGAPWPTILAYRMGPAAP